MNMIFKSICCGVMALCLALPLKAVEVNTVAGGLAGQVADTTITELTVTGTIDARDFAFIANRLPRLAALDLGNASVAAYESRDGAIFGGITSYPAATVPSLAFFGSRIKSIVLPASLKTIGFSSFASCDSLASIALPAAVDSISDYAFASCGKLQSVNIPTTVTVIGNGAFRHCDGLEQATLGGDEGTLAIGNEAFIACGKLASVTLGGNVRSIGSAAFAGCTALQSVALPVAPSLATIGDKAFMGSGLTQVALKQCSHLAAIGQWAFANTPTIKVELPASVESLGQGAFFYNTKLQAIELPQSITTVSDFLMAGCNKQMADSLLLPNGVTSIGSYAFYNWDQMARFFIPKSVTSIGDKAYAGTIAAKEIHAAPYDAPELGDSVWAGVEQKGVKLYVDKNSVAAYQAAAQWQEFDIEANASGIDDVTLDAGHGVKAYFDGTTLVIKSNDGSDIATAMLYDVNGVLLNRIAPHAPQAQMETINYTGRFYVLRVNAGGKTASFKLLRK